ncbi:hypothetical protein [Natrialba asiatica]|uniref:DUF7975 domain-containing protein n=1 Tax=Natrialba asiatica (strain ATCC 700177 / DSM 12278 / JCM 9576 / FERM P-10747 / NBRC 102637 / 172P1) TaxID=29540 RepID=M0AT63_NATA1|nr:hypothetical protein [Natrialba asiatica]ELZ01745.1 hypothetical protein C481_09502 [Natrialba asiatica DSM 12278]
MTRFDATTPKARQELYGDAITAHRTRGSGFVTFEVDPDAFESASDAESESHSDRDTESEHDPDASTGPDLDPDLGIPWLQFGDGTINIDCTDDELDRLKGLLDEFPVFKIDDLTRSEDAAGINVRVSAKADPNRIAQFIDAVFQTVYHLPSDGRVWVVDL